MRAIDHLVLPVNDLAIARKRYENLGFCVAKDGIHPFGTSNCCVFLADGTYLEPLAVHDQKLVDENVATNPFLEHDQRFRRSPNNMTGEGLSTLSLTSQQFDEEQAAFLDAGFGRDHTMSFSRAAKHADGSEDVLSVRGAFCLSDKLPNLGVFTIDWMGAPQVIAKIKAAPHHPNGVLGISAIIAEADDASVHKDYLQTAFNVPLVDGVISLANANLKIKRKAGSGLRLVAISFVVRDLTATSALMTANNVAFISETSGITVPEAQGQGVAFKFTEQG